MSSSSLFLNERLSRLSRLTVIFPYLKNIIHSLYIANETLVDSIIAILIYTNSLFSLAAFKTVSSSLVTCSFATLWLGVDFLLFSLGFIQFLNLKICIFDQLWKSSCFWMFDNCFSFYGILIHCDLNLLYPSSCFFLSLPYFTFSWLCATFWVRSLGIFLFLSLTVSYVTSKLTIILKHSTVLFNILHTRTHILEQVSALNSCVHQDPNVYLLTRRIPKDTPTLFLYSHGGNIISCLSRKLCERLLKAYVLSSLQRNFHLEVQPFLPHFAAINRRWVDFRLTSGKSEVRTYSSVLLDVKVECYSSAPVPRRDRSSWMLTCDPWTYTNIENWIF